MLGMCEIMWIPTKYFHFLISEALCCCNRAFNSLSLFSMSIFRWRAKMKDNNAEMINKYFKLILFHVLDVYFENIWSHFQYQIRAKSSRRLLFISLVKEESIYVIVSFYFSESSTPRASIFLRWQSTWTPIILRYHHSQTRKRSKYFHLRFTCGGMFAMFRYLVLTSVLFGGGMTVKRMIPESADLDELVWFETPSRHEVLVNGILKQLSQLKHNQVY